MTPMEVGLSLVLMVHYSASAEEAALWRAWREGAGAVGAPASDPSADGERVRNATVAALGAFLQRQGAELDRAAAAAVRDVLQPSANSFRSIGQLQRFVQSGNAVRYQFDFPIWHLTQIFNSLVQLVHGGEVARTSTVKRHAPSANAVYSDTNTLTETDKGTEDAPAPRYTLRQIFFDLKGSVLEPNQQRLRAWLARALDAGFRALDLAAGDIEELFRRKYLWPAITSIQQDTRTVSQYDDSIRNYSTRNFWEDYATARENFLSLSS